MRGDTVVCVLDMEYNIIDVKRDYYLFIGYL